MTMQQLSLKTLIRTLSEAAFFADRQLYRDWAETLTEMKSDVIPYPPLQPLRVSGMRVSFSAHVAEDGRFEAQEDSDLQLDFTRPEGNFNGEIVFSPYDTDTAVTPVGALDDSAADDELSVDTPTEVLAETPGGGSADTYKASHESTPVLRDI